MKKLILILFVIFFCKNVYSNNLFNSSFYSIEFTSNNIEEDKIKEITKIKKKSLLSIFNNILINQDFIKISNNISEDLINTLIKNIYINDEKIINDKYFAIVKVNFNKKKIIEFLRLNKIPYVEYHPDNFLLIIYEINNINKNLFTKNNNHYNYFNNNFKKKNIFQIPNLDINDRFILLDDHILNRDYDKINSFSKKYNSNETLIVISQTNQNFVNYELILNSDGGIAEKKLKYNMNEIDLFFQELENETLNLWKNLNFIQNKKRNFINCKINYFNLIELKEIRKNLKKVSVINDLNIKALSYKDIEYEIYYYGNLKLLFKIFKLNNLKINYDKNKCVISLI